MTELILAASFMFATHLGISGSALRAWLIGRIGERPYLILYSAVALGAIVWLISAYGRAPYVELWPMTAWSALVPLLAMPFILLMAVCGVSTLNPTAVGAPDSLDQEEPVRGMLRVTRHPFMWAVVLWAAAHLFPNGDLASLILFGSLGALALLGTRMIDRKFATRRGEAWARFAAASSNLPFAAILSGRQRLVLSEIGWSRIAIALIVYLALLAAHPWLFGVSPLAPLAAA